MKHINLKLVGIAPLLMHNGRLSDALDPATKALKVASKSTGKSTDAGQESISMAEFIGGLYVDDKGLYLPGVAFERALRDGSLGVQKGMKKKFDAGVQVLDDARLVIPTKFKSPEDLFHTGLHTFRVSARVMSARIMRTRPKFDAWSAVFRVDFNESLIDKDLLLAAAEYAGNAVGLGDWRPRFGRFTVEEV